MTSTRATYTASVDRVYKGDVGATQELVTAVSGSACGLELRIGERALIFGSQDPSFSGSLAPGQLSAHLCNGTTAQAEAPAAWGSGSPPTDAQDPETSGGSDPAPSFAAEPVAGAGGDGDSTRSTLLAVVLGLAIGATVGLWWVARRRARPDEVGPDSPGTGGRASGESGPRDPRAGPPGSDHGSDSPS